MTIVELLVASGISMSLMASYGLNLHHLYKSISHGQSQAVLHSESLQAIQIMERAIWFSNNPKKESKLLSLDIGRSCALEFQRMGHFQIRKGIGSVNGADCFYTYNAKAPKIEQYKGVFIQHQGKGADREGVLYIQTKTQSGRLQNEALMGHVIDFQIQGGVMQPNGQLWWQEPHELNRLPKKKSSTQAIDIAAIKISMTLQNGNYRLPLQKIIARRHAKD